MPVTRLGRSCRQYSATTIDGTGYTCAAGGMLRIGHPDNGNGLRVADGMPLTGICAGDSRRWRLAMRPARCLMMRAKAWAGVARPGLTSAASTRARLLVAGLIRLAIINLAIWLRRARRPERARDIHA